MKAAQCYRIGSALLACLAAISRAQVGGKEVNAACYGPRKATAQCSSAIAHAIVHGSSICFEKYRANQGEYNSCAQSFCNTQAHAEQEKNSGNVGHANDELRKLREMSELFEEIDGHLHKVADFQISPESPVGSAPKFLQRQVIQAHSGPKSYSEDTMTEDSEANFDTISPFGKEDTAQELQAHAAKTQDTLVDAVENAVVAELKRAVFRSLTRLRAATIKEFDSIARLQTQAIDAYNDAHHYRAENPLGHLHSSEAPVNTDKHTSFH